MANQTIAHIIEECPLYRYQRKVHFGNQFPKRDVK
jgi:hypothetical protein